MNPGRRISRKTVAAAGVIATIAVIAAAVGVWRRLDGRRAAGTESAVHYVIGCHVFREDRSFLTRFPGRFCLFMEDGSLIQYRPGAGTLLRTDARGAVLWERPIQMHHQMRWSEGGRRLLLLGSDVEKTPECLLRHDVVLSVDVGTGEVVHRWSGRDHQELYRKWNPGLRLDRTRRPDLPGLRFECEQTHFNSVQEIPEVRGDGRGIGDERFRQGNVLVNALGLNRLIWLDPRLEKVVATETPDQPGLWLHDVQMLPSGQLLYFNNDYPNDGRDYVVPRGPGHRSTLEIFDFGSRKVTRRFPDAESGPHVFTKIGGGVQLIGNDLLFSFNEPSGGKVYRVDGQGKVLWTMEYPFKNTDGSPTRIQEIKQLDLSLFLSRNRTW